MSTELDLDDVANTSPLAAAELADLRASAASLAVERAEFRREAERLKELLAAYESAEVVEVQYRTASHSVWMPRTFFRPTDESTAEYRELIVKPKRAQQPAGGTE